MHQERLAIPIFRDRVFIGIRLARASCTWLQIRAPSPMSES
jgi:hypothetical protein